MDEILIIAAFGAFFAAALTVPAGFGLSTMLTPFTMGIFELVHIIFLAPGLFTLMAVKKHIYLAEDTTASKMIKISMTLTMMGLILAALM